MRVTQSMLSNNMIRNLSTSYNKMGKLQSQLETGKKVNRPSDDPVVAMKGIGYRTQLGKVEQFQRNLGEVHNWLDSSDDALDKVGEAMKRANELVLQANNGTLTKDDRLKALSELEQLQKHIQDLSNTKVGDKYIFSGTKTKTPLFGENGYPSDADEASFKGEVKIEVFDGISLDVNTDVVAMFKDIDKTFTDLKSAIESEEPLDDFIGQLSKQTDVLLETRANIGARQNRAELMEDRLSSQEVSATKLMSENEEIDYEKVITEMITQESVHRAALSVGSRIIQPSLVDFLR